MELKIFSILMVLIGAVILCLSFLPALKIHGSLKGRIRDKWLLTNYLIGFFILGYVFYDIILISNLRIPLELVTGTVFLGGAVFVYIIINLSRISIVALQNAEEVIHIAKDDWESTFDAVTDAITVHDMHFNIILANPAAREMFELKQHDGASMGKCFRSYHGTDKPPSECVSCQSLMTGKPTASETYESHLDKHLEIRAMPRFGKAGQQIGLIHVVRDITERKRAEKENDILKSQLIQAQKMESIGRLAGGVAHDFNNMLCVILGYGNMLRAEIPPNDPRHESVLAIVDAGVRSTNIVRQLLAFARKQTISPHVLDLNKGVEEMLKMLRRLIGEDIDLEWHSSSVCPVFIDPSQLDQILANLCVNARDAINGVGKVIIKTESICSNEVFCSEQQGFITGEYVQLSISDNGDGMDRDTVSKIFEPFFTTKQVDKGTGLGLATVYGIIKQNNGFIDVCSEPGMGTTFKVFLPRHTEQVTVSKTAVSEMIFQDQSAKILVVEDEPSILKFTTKTLKNLGHNILAASGANDALELAKHETIDLLLTDVIMPGMNGRDLANSLLVMHPKMKYVFMSGYTSTVIASHGVLEKGEYFIQKPFSANELGTKIQDALKGLNGRCLDTDKAGFNTKIF